jgi:hypothetical protein
MFHGGWTKSFSRRHSIVRSATIVGRLAQLGGFAASQVTRARAREVFIGPLFEKEMGMDDVLPPGCPRHAEAANRNCYDLRCQRTWKVRGAPSPDEQLRLWVSGKSVCPNEDHECCPDFSCCRPALLWPLERRQKFASVGQEEREKMLVGALGAAVEEAGFNVDVVRRVVKDCE